MVPTEIIGAVNALLSPYGQSYGNETMSISPKDAQRYCGLSSKKLRNLALAGEIKSIRVSNRCVLLVKASLDEWLAARMAK